MSLTCFTILFFLIAGGISVFFYGRRAYEIHKILKQDKKTDSKYRRWNQYWLNFLGSFTGFIALYYFLIFRLDLFLPNYSILEFRAGWSDFVVILVIFLGITGYLPYAVLLGRLFKT